MRLAHGLKLWGIVCLLGSFMPVEAKPPHIVFVLADDLGGADLGCYGSQFHETPNIDRLASQGVRFTDFYAAGAVCSPTRAAIQSGQNQARLGITDYIPGHRHPYAKLRVPPLRSELPLEVVTPAEHLHSQGYVSGYFGKWHLGNAGYLPEQQGYDVSLVTSGRHFAPNFRVTPPREVPDGTYLADFLTNEALGFLKTHRDRPCFVQISHYAVHVPLEARPETVAKYEAKPKPPTGVNNPIYAAMVEHLDTSVGRLMAGLEELGIADETLLIFTSDNGGLRQSAGGKGPIVCSNAPLRDEKGSLYEGGIRVPLIVRWPGVTTAGTICREPVSSVDFWPTFSAAAGAPLPADYTLDGESLVPLLKDATIRLNREALYWHYPHYHHSRPAGAIRARDWKLIEFYDGAPAELYQISTDLSEERDLASQQPERVAELRQQLADWRARVNAVMPTPNPDYDPAREHEIATGRRRKNQTE